MRSGSEERDSPFWRSYLKPTIVVEERRLPSNSVFLFKPRPAHPHPRNIELEEQLSTQHPLATEVVDLQLYSTLLYVRCFGTLLQWHPPRFVLIRYFQSIFTAYGGD